MDAKTLRLLLTALGVFATSVVIIITATIWSEIAARQLEERLAAEAAERDPEVAAVEQLEVERVLQASLPKPKTPEKPEEPFDVHGKSRERAVNHISAAFTLLGEPETVRSVAAVSQLLKEVSTGKALQSATENEKIIFCTAVSFALQPKADDELRMGYIGLLFTWIPQLNDNTDAFGQMVLRMAVNDYNPKFEAQVRTIGIQMNRAIRSAVANANGHILKAEILKRETNDYFSMTIHVRFSNMSTKEFKGKVIVQINDEEGNYVDSDESYVRLPPLESEIEKISFFDVPIGRMQVVMSLQEPDDFAFEFSE